jgi:hypothetical protein
MGSRWQGPHPTLLEGGNDDIMGAWWNHVYAATQYEVVYRLYHTVHICWQLPVWWSMKIFK